MAEQEQVLYCDGMSTATEKVPCMKEQCAKWRVVQIQKQGKFGNIVTEEQGMCVFQAIFIKPPVILQQGGGMPPGMIGRN